MAKAHGAAMMEAVNRWLADIWKGARPIPSLSSSILSTHAEQYVGG
jgi:hypothetical protein